MLRDLFRPAPEAQAARTLYERLVAQARDPVFYRDLGVPDSLDGRFEMVTLHAFLILHRLKAEGERGEGLGQRLFDLFFADMDQSLRELGAGDLGVGKRVRRMVEGFYGRVAAYDGALGADGPEALEGALARNVYGTVAAPEGAPAVLADYLRREVEALSRIAYDDLAAGDLRFGAPPGPGAGAGAK